MSSFENTRFYEVFVSFGFSCFRSFWFHENVIQNEKQKWTNKENWISSSLIAPPKGKIMFKWTNNHLGFSVSLVVVALSNNCSKKSRLSVTCKLATLIWSFSRSFTRQQIRVRLVSLTHQSYMACIRPSYCYAREKFGLSISAGSFIALISQSNAVGSRKNEPVWCSWHDLDAMCFTCGHKLLLLVPSLPQLLFSVRLFYVSVGVIFSNPKINSMISLTFTKDAKCLFYFTYTEIHVDHWMWFWKSFQKDFQI